MPIHSVAEVTQTSPLKDASSQSPLEETVPHTLESHIGQRAGRERPSNHSTALDLGGFPGTFPKHLREGEDQHTQPYQKIEEGRPPTTFTAGVTMLQPDRGTAGERPRTGIPREHRRRLSQQTISESHPTIPRKGSTSRVTGFSLRMQCGSALKNQSA